MRPHQVDGHARAAISRWRRASTTASRAVDRAVLLAALARLPAKLPPLTPSPTAADLRSWIELHEADDEGLGQLIEEPRRHEPMP